MSKIIFITHPSVIVSKSLSPKKWELSEKGIFEVRQLLKKTFWSEVKAIYSSIEPKSLMVAEMVARQHHCKVIKDTCLSEVDRTKGIFLEKNEYVEAMNDFYKFPNHSINNWETANHAKDRFVECVSMIMKNYSSDDTIAIIGHGPTGTLLTCYIKGIEPSYDEDPKKNGCITVIDWTKKEIITPWEEY